MTDVTIDNFEAVFPVVEHCLKNATFVAIDNEMSGIKSDHSTKESLFDTPSERYTHLKRNIEPFIIIQAGVTTFRYVRDANKFVADSFNFYLMPRSIPTKNRQFEWQSSAIEFLTKFRFDFSKMAYKGISYLNKEEEKDMRKKINDGSFLQSTANYIPFDIYGTVQKSINLVHNWLNTDDACLILPAETPLIEYLLHKHIRMRYKNTWTIVGIQQVFVVKVDPNERHEYINNEGENFIDERFINYYIGFSKIFQLLAQAKKPIVGHNVFLDYMFMYKQFHGPLPEKYETFKKDIHELFPYIYDTKNISFNLGCSLKQSEKWKSNGLGDMYLYFTKEQGLHLVMFSPTIERNSSLQFNDVLKVHDASWDSYYSGYIFIKMAHVFAVKKCGAGADLKPITCKEMMSGVQQYENCVNIIRALVSHVNFNGPDPQSNRPEWLYAKLLVTDNRDNRDISELTETLSTFGNVDVKRVSSTSALIAAGNHYNKAVILNHYKSSKDFKIVPYNPLLHSYKVMYMLAAGVLMTGSLVVFLVFTNFFKVKIHS